MPKRPEILETSETTEININAVQLAVRSLLAAYKAAPHEGFRRKYPALHASDRNGAAWNESDMAYQLAGLVNCVKEMARIEQKNEDFYSDLKINNKRRRYKALIQRLINADRPQIQMLFMSYPLALIKAVLRELANRDSIHDLGVDNAQQNMVNNKVLPMTQQQVEELDAFIDDFSGYVASLTVDQIRQFGAAQLLLKIAPLERNKLEVR